MSNKNNESISLYRAFFLKFARQNTDGKRRRSFEIDIKTKWNIDGSKYRETQGLEMTLPDCTFFETNV